MRTFRHWRSETNCQIGGSCLLSSQKRLAITRRPEESKKGCHVSIIRAFVTDLTARTVGESGIGSADPVSEMCEEIDWFFRASGFDVTDTPEIETEKNNFDILGTSSQHPSRSQQDTFYLDVCEPNGKSLLLRTHMTAAHQHFLTKRTPPLKMASVGKVFRKDSDSHHLPSFHQAECLWVAEMVSLRQLRGLYFSLLNGLFSSKNISFRLRSSHFPFTEPSVELDIKMPSQVGWSEVSGGGLLRPNVLSNLGIDAKKFGGLAFGIGIERLVMMRRGLPDIRSLLGRA